MHAEWLRYKFAFPVTCTVGGMIALMPASPACSWWHSEESLAARLVVCKQPKNLHDDIMGIMTEYILYIGSNLGYDLTEYILRSQRSGFIIRLHDIFKMTAYGTQPCH